MDHITVGKKYNKGKIAFVKCFKNNDLENVNIKDKCFLLIILSKGKIDFEVNHEKITATAPCFICFDESENPIFHNIKKAVYTSIFFHPKYLNVNMTFKLLRTKSYDDIATNHDMFMLKPFINKAYTIPIVNTQIEKIEYSANCMGEELEYQRDWYWSCRGRSYFMEIIIALERMYGLIGYGAKHQKADNMPLIENPKLREAVLYIESHYGENITLSDISSSAGINSVTLTSYIKKELGCTAIEYLMQYRITIAKKQLAFTNVPIKDIANMVGFKTVQHFNRIFKKFTLTTPAEFRKNSVKNRKENFNGK